MNEKINGLTKKEFHHYCKLRDQELWLQFAMKSEMLMDQDHIAFQSLDGTDLGTEELLSLYSKGGLVNVILYNARPYVELKSLLDGIRFKAQNRRPASDNIASCVDLFRLSCEIRDLPESLAPQWSEDLSFIANSVLAHLDHFQYHHEFVDLLDQKPLVDLMAPIIQKKIIFPYAADQFESTLYNNLQTLIAHKLVTVESRPLADYHWLCTVRRESDASFQSARSPVGGV